MFLSLLIRRQLHVAVPYRSPSINKRVTGFSVKEELSEFLDCNSKTNITCSRLSNDEYRYTPFRQVINGHREAAERTILVQVKSQESADDLVNYCSTNFGRVKALHFHQNKNNVAFENFFLVEFDKTSSVSEAVLKHCHHSGSSKTSGNIPVYSPFLWFTGKLEGSTLNTHPVCTTPIFLPPKQISTDNELSEHLSQFSTLDEQMVALQSVQSMTSISTRIRFLACHQIELCLRGLFSKSMVLPFGSSVNSFGKRDSDLDMVVVLDSKEKSGSSRLMFQAKGSNHGGHRLQCQRYCDQISNMLQHFLPGCQDVQNILHARVPIVKYEQQLLGLECDLSVSSLSGFYMSELLYLFGELDWRVRPLVFTLRRWARDQGLIQNMRPTHLFTNFSITLLVIFFLQKKYGMLPPLQELQRLARPEDNITCDDGVRCNYLRDISGLHPSLNTHYHDDNLTLAQMLADFFNFFGHEFDYSSDAACVISGDIQPKRSNANSKISARNVRYFIDITNPLEPDLNVSANVQDHAVKKFRQKCDESLMRLCRLQDKSVNNIAEPKLMYLLSNHIPARIFSKTQEPAAAVETNDAPKLNLKLYSLYESNKDPKSDVPLSDDKMSKGQNVALEERETLQNNKKNQKSLKVRNFFKHKF